MMMIEQDSFAFRVIDLKQYAYCPRILYYHTVLPQVRPLTYKMEAGIRAHVQTEGKEKRRSLKAYGLEAGVRTFNVPLFSAELGLSGVLDMLIETEDALIPVDFKQSKKVGNHFKLQLVAYGRLLAARANLSGKSIQRGFLYMIPRRTAVAVPFSIKSQHQFDRALADLKRITVHQKIPPPTKQAARCVDCEFRRFCNDIG